MKYWESSKFKSLQQEWYDKLAESGFEDIEYAEGTDILKGVNGALIKREHVSQLEARQQYYMAAERWTPRVRASTKRQRGLIRKAWRLHAEGETTESISRKLGVGKSTIIYWVAKEAKKMKDWIMAHGELP